MRFSRRHTQARKARRGAPKAVAHTMRAQQRDRVAWNGRRRVGFVNMTVRTRLDRDVPVLEMSHLRSPPSSLEVTSAELSDAIISCAR